MRDLSGPTLGVAVALVLASAAASAQAPVGAEAITVRFELNDAQVKGKLLPGAEVKVVRPSGGEPVASGRTGADGRFEARVPPGSYEIGYRLEGYVPYTSEATELSSEGQLVTVSLSRMVEATAAAARDVRVILNWGSRQDQVRDADAHLVCACAGEGSHVYYRNPRHDGAQHSVALDVDDTDWGGPETITLTTPPRGSYVYRVYDYSGPPAVLGTSDIVVRVLIGSEPAGEFRVPRGLTRRSWRPFKAVEVQGDGPPALVRWTEDEIAEGLDLEIPQERAAGAPDAPEAPAPQVLAGAGALLVIGLVVWRVRRARSRRR